MSEIDERNMTIQALLNRLYSLAADANYHVDEIDYKDALDALFSTNVWGYREVLLVVLVGMKLSSDYKASTGFYKCNPRAIYEGPIIDFLYSKNIPCRKSGPLNVAKATIGLNEAWAAQRRPRDVADKVVSLINYLERPDIDREEITTRMAVSLFRRFMCESKRIDELSIDILPSEDPEFLFRLCNELITKAPDAGNTPQKIAALLLKNYHLSMHTGIIVTGVEDSASVTNTTGKKPGDINEESANGSVFKVYEITVKPFTHQRVRESFDSVKQYNTLHNKELKEIVVICRPSDCPHNMCKSHLHSYMGHISHQNIIYYYWDIYEWIAELLQRMIPEGRKSFHSELNAYINQTNTSEKVKNIWKNLHESE